MGFRTPAVDQSHWSIEYNYDLTSVSFTHTQTDSTYHFNDVHFSGDPKLVEERGEVLLHLDAVVLHL